MIHFIVSGTIRRAYRPEMLYSPKNVLKASYILPVPCAIESIVPGSAGFAGYGESSPSGFTHQTGVNPDKAVSYFL